MSEAFRYVVLGEYKYVLLNDNNYEIHDGHYLNGTIFHENRLEPSEEEELFRLHDKLVCVVDVDQLNNFQPRDMTPFTQSSLISTDGVPIMTNKASFCIKIFNDIGEVDKYDNQLIFKGNIFTQGMPFKFVDDLYIQSLELNNGRYLYHKDGKIHFIEGKPVDNNVWFVKGRHPGLFYLCDGDHYYVVRFYTASYGEVLQVDNKDEATVFQLISL
jgi:hypothetical protein